LQLHSVEPQLLSGQSSEAQALPPQLVLHPQAGSQFTDAHDCVTQLMLQSPRPHAIAPHVFWFVHSMTQTPALQLMASHAPLPEQRIVQLSPAHSIPPRHAFWFVH
jgi:hypothetical protein